MFACLAAGGKLHEICFGRYYCKENDSDFVRLMNFDRNDECVATICLDEELDDHTKELMQDEAEMFGTVLSAECRWERLYGGNGCGPGGAMKRMASSLFKASLVVATMGIM